VEITRGMRKKEAGEQRKSNAGREVFWL